MISLTRLARLRRAIVAGDGSLDLYLALRRRGFIRVATPALCRIPKGQHTVGLITGQNSNAGIKSALDRNIAVPSTSAASRFWSAPARAAWPENSRETGKDWL